MTKSLAVNAHRYVKSGLTGYDACYAALAEETKGKWLTFDKKAHLKIQSDNVSVSLELSLPGDWF
jgi:predicted nucleic acid-binding protein